MGDIFREIDEELRQEKAQKIWRAYGKYIIGGVVAIVIAVAGYSGWRQYLESRNLEAGAKFAAAKALLAEGKTEDAAALFAALARESDTTYGTLSRFHEAALMISAGDRAGAVATFRALSNDQGLDRTMRELATILAALNSTGAAGAEVVAELTPLAEDGSPWRHTALEILGLTARSRGEIEEARGHFQRIVDDVEAPTNVRSRAARLLSTMTGP